ncbi:transcriptional repressor p66-beta isoform X2 [Eurosta solidaginis]|uniref:transcriptional repressor p66-beta isoform X2 n=1 Tax=Eurosta solidaginis TaxID=178769 RepID=UPI003530D4FF
MAKMDVDDVVDLSLGSGRDPALAITSASMRDVRILSQNSGLTITPTSVPSTTNTNELALQEESKVQRRVLRPRTEPKSYAEAPDIVLLPARLNGRQHNGNIDSETDDEDSASYVPIKELSPTEIEEREKGLRKLREDLRNEETKLVLLKKLKQSQHVMKENLALNPIVSSANPIAVIPAALTAKCSLSVTTSTPCPVTSKSRAATVNINTTSSRNAVLSSSTIAAATPSFGRINPSVVPPPPRSSLPGGTTLTTGNTQSSHRIHPRSNLPNLTITPSVTITPTTAPPSGSKSRNINISENLKITGIVNNSVSITPASNHLQQSQQQQQDLKNERHTGREESMTPAQRQAAAKLALRKQLEKTLLQIPPPKPPPPEMHFVPNPSNTEFVYLLGLETVVDYLTTNNKKATTVVPPFHCAQCKIDFTPVWKWDKQRNKATKVICEQCVTTNVKKALKAEHTNRLKQAFVKALQQEQEIEQRITSQSNQSPADAHSSSAPSTQSPVQQQLPILQMHQQQQSSPSALVNLPPSVTVIPTKCHTPTPSVVSRPTPPPCIQQTPTPPPGTARSSRNQQATLQTTPIPTPQIQREREQVQQQQHQQYDKYTTAALAAAAAQLSALGSLPGFNSLTNLSGLGNLGQPGNFSALGGFANIPTASAANPSSLGNASSSAQAAAFQAFQQQLLRALGQGLAANPQHMMQFTPLLYSYQMAMAQAAQVAGNI